METIEQTAVETYEQKQDRKRTESIQGMRALCDFLEANPTIESPLAGGYMTIYVTPDQLKATARTLGSFTKSADADYYRLVKDFGGGVELHTITSRSAVCKKVKVGTQTVVKKVIDPAYVRPITPMVEVEVEEDVYEMQCPESILNFTPEVEA